MLESGATATLTFVTTSAIKDRYHRNQFTFFHRDGVLAVDDYDALLIDGLVTHDMAVHASLTNKLAIMYAGKIVEESPTPELFKNPLHPYTRFLIGSLPRIGDKTYKVSAPGAPPSLAALPPGCRFHPRCPRAMDRCRTQEPELVTVSPGHRVACFLSGGSAAGEP